jgi:Cu-Zn family superoxide dismutase
MIDRHRLQREGTMSPHRALLLVLAALLACACATSAPAPAYVAATLQPTRGNSAAGAVWFIAEGTDLRIRGRVTGLLPNQEHGFHVHEKGDCSSGDGMSAGGHFNPTGKPHGAQSAEHHAGDLPALKADASGTAVVDARVSGVAGGPNAFAGKALIVHVAPDDYVTQPTGNSGARIACGVLLASAPRDAAGRELALPSDR